MQMIMNSEIKIIYNKNRNNIKNNNEITIK